MLERNAAPDKVTCPGRTLELYWALRSVVCVLPHIRPGTVPISKPSGAPVALLACDFGRVRLNAVYAARPRIGGAGSGSRVCGPEYTSVTPVKSACIGIFRHTPLPNV